MEKVTIRLARGFARTKQYRRPLGVALATVLVTGLSSCDGLLDVELPGQLPATAITDPSMANVLINSVQADFECALSDFAAFTALYTDEMQSASSFGPSVELVDLRLSTILDSGASGCSGSQNSTANAWYLPLQTARVQAKDAYASIAGHPSNLITNQTHKLATAAMYEGFSLAFLGEGFCEMVLDGGSRMDRAAVLTIAEQRFTVAIAHAQEAAATDLLNAARVGRARVRLRLGNLTGAAADAALVPVGFIKYALYDEAPGRRTNRVQTINQLTRHASIDPRFRGLTVDGKADPRVNVTNSGFRGSDGTTALWITQKYLTPGSDIPMAKWEEAQLILAEALGGADAVAAINRLRERAGLANFTGSTAAEIRAAILEERARVLFLEGRRIGDLVGYTELKFQTGLTHKGNSFNDDLQCLPLPNAELFNNPNL